MIFLEPSTLRFLQLKTYRTQVKKKDINKQLAPLALLLILVYLELANIL
jgi:hypothetical protein